MPTRKQHFVMPQAVSLGNRSLRQSPGLEIAVENAGAPDPVAADEFTSRNTWDFRIQEMLDALYPEEAKTCGGDLIRGFLM